ncbi:arginase family enzyme [Humitalea rosea]|uniref:Arginase family enzyme n=1 Tax=Humitalea rosea TaxID=990373 RepID=A0A2W7KLK2_9PROT|nr:hypothetical protein [Humitalea rosea]PZW49198.1 arginase family enzyme [Humitalea rosea]
MTGTRCLVLDLDGSLPGQPALRRRLEAGAATLVPATDLAARLRILADPAALAALRQRIAVAFPVAGGPPPVVFYGSGDFHHLAALFLGALPGPLTVLHIDNHPDWTRFPATLNCGAWVCRALELPQVQRVITIGPASDDFVRPEWKFANLAAIRQGRLEVHPFRAAPSRLWGRAVEAPGCHTEAGRLVWHELAATPWSAFVRALDARLPATPFWVSFDKDALTAEEAVTNWDQGALRLDDVLALVARLGRRRRWLGMDVCGDYSPPVFPDPLRAMLSAIDRPGLPRPPPGHAAAVNDRTNARILDAVEGWA